MYGIENKLYEQLLLLKNDYGIKGLKAEFEAEGSSYRDLTRLRRITERAGIELYLKIGGVEAMRDIKDSMEIGVDGLIAPMVESVFGVKKFQQAYDKVYKDHRIHLSINIESKCAVENIDAILDYSKGKIDNVTIGRTDLSGSYFDANIYPDCDEIMQVIAKMAVKVKERGMTMTVGGGISVQSVEAFKNIAELEDKISHIETRKVVFPVKMVMGKDSAVREALRFEEYYILSKSEINGVFMESDVARLTQLQRRL